MAKRFDVDQWLHDCRDGLFLRGHTSKGKPFTIIWDMGLSQSCLTACTTSNQPLPSSTYTTWTDLKGNSNQISGGSVPVGYKPILIE